MGDRIPRQQSNRRPSPRRALSSSSTDSPYSQQQRPPPNTAVYHAPPPPPFSSPSPITQQNNPNVHYSGTRYASVQSYPPNFQRIPYPTTPPVSLPQYYYPYGQSPLGAPPVQYAYAEPGRSHSDAPQYGDPGQQQQQQPPHPASPGPGPSSMASATYARMTYAAPIPYPYSIGPPPSLTTLGPPVYASRNTYHAPVAQLDHPGQEYWYVPPHEVEQQHHSPHPVHSPPPPPPPQSSVGRPSASTSGNSMSSRSYSHSRTTHTSEGAPSLSRLSSWGPHVSTSESESLASPARERNNNPPSSRRTHQSHPPPNRSDWVMWVGNIPSDCDREELQTFFDSILWPEPSSSEDPETSAAESEETPRSGVISVFLISQSNCAFVNYDSEARLLNAVAKCNGVAIRPDDPRCIKLVCRVRKKDEDMRAGVGAQRGVRLHTAWVQQQQKVVKSKGGPQGETPRASLPTMAVSPTTAGPSPPSPPDHANTSPIVVPPEGSSGSVSFTSTNSSFLATYFPQRYFILKSLTVDDLKLSVEQGMWKTQSHNEEALDQAYRTSKDVFLIFGANKTGEFFGYARMSGPIRRQASTHDILAERSPVAQSSAPPAFMGGGGEYSPTTSSHYPTNRFLLTPGAPLRESPLPVSPNSPRSTRAPSTAPTHAATAPPEMVEPFRRISLNHTPPHASTYEEKRTFQLDPHGPRRAIRVPETVDERAQSTPPDSETVPTPDGGPAPGADDAPSSPSGGADRRPLPKPVQRHADSDPGAAPGDAKAGDASEGPSWGTSFPITWIRVQPLSFTRTRTLRNPWNGNREVKVSRDGTELEPPVGAQLLALWDEQPTTPSGGSGQPKRGGNPRTAGGRRG